MADSGVRRPVDMSPAALDRRMRDLSQLYRLGMLIKQAKRLGTVEEHEQATQAEGGPLLQATEAREDGTL